MSRSLRPSVATHWPRLVTAVLVLLLGAALRFAYYDTWHGQSDEDITMEVVRYMRHSGDWDVNWRNANLPADLRYDQFNFSSHLYATYFFYRATKLLPGLDRWRSEREGFLVYRFFVAALATLAVLQTLQLGRRLGGWNVGLGAAALTAGAPLLVQDAHYVRPEPFTAVLTLAAVALAWPGPRGSAGRVIGSAFCIGLLVACKISMLLLIWLPFVPLAAGWRGFPARRWLVAAVPLAIVAGAALGAPGAVTQPAAFLHGVRQLAAQYAGLHPPHSHLNGGPVGDMQLSYFAATLGWPALVAWAIGGAWLARRRRWEEFALLAGPVLLFAGYFATRSVFFERNLSHIVPLFAIVAAFGAVQAVTYAAARLRAPATLLGLAVFTLLMIRPLQASWSLVSVELSGRGSDRYNAFEAGLRHSHPEAEWQAALLLDDTALRELATRFRGTQIPVLLRVTDYRDEWTAHNVALLAERFVTREVSVYAGTFPALPTCTLLTYHSPTDRYFLITGARSL